MLKMMLGRSGAGKTEQIIRTIAESGGARPQILIVPEQHSHDMERRLCALGGAAVSSYAEVLSFTRLANRVSSVVGGLAAPVLDPGGRVLLMYSAVQAVADKLTIYQRPSRRPAFLTGLLATVDELKACRISSADLWKAWEETGEEDGAKLRDLSLIYGAYQAMTERQAADPLDRLDRLAEGLKESRWAEGKDFYLDGFTDFTAQERQVIEQLLRQGASVTVALTCELEGDAAVFAPAGRTARQLFAMSCECDPGDPTEFCRMDGPGRSRTAALATVEQALSVGAEPRENCEGILLYRACSPYSELEWVASEILRLVREEGYRFRDITVTGRSLEGREENLVILFRRYGIPAFFSAMSDVLQRPVFAVVMAALAAVSGGYQYEDVFRYLKTGLTGIDGEERDLLENYALKWDLKGSCWTEKRPWAMHPRGYGLEFTDEDTALLERLNGIRSRVTEPLERLRKSAPSTGRGWATALYAFLQEISLPETLLRRADELTEGGDPALADEYGQLWDILCEALEQCAILLNETEMGLEEFAKLLGLCLSQYDVGTIPVSVDRVAVGDMPRMAHKPCKALFLIGADDGAIPRPGTSPGLLSDDDRSLLSSFGLETAPGRTERLDREMTMVYETCALPDSRLTVSWSAAGSGGEEHRPAFLVGHLQKLFPELKIVTEESLNGAFRLAAPLPALELAGRDANAAAALMELPDSRPGVERLYAARGLKRGAMSREAVDALYGRLIPLSASRMDLVRSCHFSYFMRYGLKAEARRAAGFQAPEYGTFVHDVLQHVLEAREEWDGPDGYDRKKLRACTGRAIDRYVAERLGSLEGESPRFQYLFRRLKRTVYAVVDNVAQELERSEFTPIAFELGFAKGKEMPPVELRTGDLTLSISGFVDRVDGWERDGKLYLRVVDYKTGRKSFDLTDIWNGLGLQMLLYLFTLKDRGSEYFGRAVTPAGVLYLPAREAIIAGGRALTEEQRQSEVDAVLRRSGLILDEPDVLSAMEDMEDGKARFLPVRLSAKTGAVTGEALVSAERLGKLERHIQNVLNEMGEEFARGVIDADPFWKGPEKNACQWCEYAQACQFEEGVGGDKRRWLNTVKAEEFWKQLSDDGGSKEKYKNESEEAK